MKAKHVLAVISFLVLCAGLGGVYNMETGRVVSDWLPWTNIVIGSIGMISSIIYFSKYSFK
jgi:hypothetical protein